MATRRTHTREFKREAVQLLIGQGLSVAEAARRLGVSENLLRKWKQMAEAEGEHAFPGHGNLPPLEAELHRLRAENKRLREEQEILKQAAAYFARESL